MPHTSAAPALPPSLPPVAAPLLRPVASVSRRVRPRPGWVQGSLALQWRTGPVEAAPDPAVLRLVPAGHGDETDPVVAAVPTGASALPDAGAWVATLAQAVLEVLAHERPRQQLVRWLAPEVYADLSRHVAAAPGRRPGTARRSVSSVHVSQPADGVVEASVVAVGGPRARALALRLEGWDGRWRCTRLALL